MSVNELAPMLGVTMLVVREDDDDGLTFHGEENDFRFYHDQDCCESVNIEDIAGDLLDLVGSPLLMAEEVSNEPEPGFADNEYIPESYTWTFYKFATVKGSVTVRWLGTSNGYYSESVSFAVLPASTCTVHEDCKATTELGRACWLASHSVSPRGEGK